MEGKGTAPVNSLWHYGSGYCSLSRERFRLTIRSRELGPLRSLSSWLPFARCFPCFYIERYEQVQLASFFPFVSIRVIFSHMVFNFRLTLYYFIFLFPFLCFTFSFIFILFWFSLFLVIQDFFGTLERFQKTVDFLWIYEFISNQLFWFILYSIQPNFTLFSDHYYSWFNFNFGSSAFFVHYYFCHRHIRFTIIFCSSTFLVHYYFRFTIIFGL